MFTPEIILYILIAFIVFDSVKELILDLLNISYQNKPVPTSINDIYTDEEKKLKAKAYQKETTRFGIGSNLFQLVLYVVVLAFGWLGDINEFAGTYTDHAIFKPLLFFGIIFIISDIIQLPFQYYSTFVIEEKYGFNKSTLKIFIIDKIKGYVLTILVGGGILYLLFQLVYWLEQDFWIYFWIAISVLVLFLNMFYTSLIVPLFNKLTPLEDGELRQAIEAYSKKVGFELTNIYIIDGSKRSTKANAYFSGIGPKKKIVLFDTLVNNHTIEELVAVLAHEVGHFKHKHIIYSLVLSIVQTGAILFLLSQFMFNENLSLALGAQQWEIHLNLIAFGMLLTPLNTLLGLGINLFSRKNEYEADAFAKNTYGEKPLISALKKLSGDNLSNLTPHPLYVFMHYSHPPLYQRIAALSDEKAK